MTILLPSGQTDWPNFSVPNVGANSLVYASPKTTGEYGDRNFNLWTNCGVRPYAQGDGTISFKARSQPDNGVGVNLAIFNPRSVS